MKRISINPSATIHDRRAREPRVLDPDALADVIGGAPIIVPESPIIVPQSGIIVPESKIIVPTD